MIKERNKCVSCVLAPAPWELFHMDIINGVMFRVMKHRAPNEKHEADFSSTPHIFTVNRSLPADPLWEQVEPARVCSCLQTCRKKFTLMAPHGPGGELHHRDENQCDSTQTCFFLLPGVRSVIRLGHSWCGLEQHWSWALNEGMRGTKTTI